MSRLISITARHIPRPVLQCFFQSSKKVGVNSRPYTLYSSRLPNHEKTSEILVDLTHKSITCNRFLESRNKFHVSTSFFQTELVKTPAFADSVSEGDVKFTAKVGDYVQVDQVVMEIETDKTTVGVPAPFGGIIEEILVKDGQTVKAGQELFKLKKAEVGIETASPTKPPSLPNSDASSPKTDALVSPPKTSHTPKPAQTPPKPIASHSQQVASLRTPLPPKLSVPAAKIPSANIPNAKGITQPTVKVPPSDYTKEITGTRTEQRVKMNRMRLKIAQRLKDAQNINAMLTTFNEIDMSSAMAFRKANQDAFQKKFGIKLGFMSIFTKAAAYALQDQPVINAVIDGNEIIYRDYIDISVAVATPKGLVVPVIRNVESMNYADIEIALAVLGEKAKKGAIDAEDMAGGTFTISNGGVFGSLISTPIINPPQSSILGMHGIFDRPVAVKGEVVIRPMMYIAVTYDHRLIDGREAVMFLRKIKAAVEDPRIMLAGL